jgi:hypothetical protein
MTATIHILDHYRPATAARRRRRPLRTSGLRPTPAQLKWLSRAGSDGLLPNRKADGYTPMPVQTMIACENRGWAKRTRHPFWVDLPDGAGFMETDPYPNSPHCIWHITEAGRAIVREYGGG